MLINEMKIRTDVKLSEAKFYNNQNYENSLRLKGIFFLIISVMGSTRENYQMESNTSNRNDVELTDDNQYYSKTKFAFKFDNVKKDDIDEYLRKLDFGKFHATLEVTDQQKSLKSKFFLSVYDFNIKLKNNSSWYLNKAQTDVLSLHSQSFFKVLKSLYNGKNDHILIDLFNNQEFEDEILSRITLEDILMTISLEKFIAVPEHFESQLKDALSTINQTLKSPLSESELESLKKIIMVYPSTSSFCNQERQLREFGKNVFKTLNNFFELKSHILKLKDRIPLSKRLNNNMSFRIYTCHQLTPWNTVSITIDDQSDDFIVQALSIDFPKSNSAIETLAFLNALLDLSHLKNLKVMFVSYLWFQPNADEIRSTFCSIVEKATKLEELIFESGSGPLLNEISSNLPDILKKLDNLHSLSLLTPIDSIENFNEIILSLKDKPIIKRLEIANCAYNLCMINNRQFYQSGSRMLSFLRGKIEKLVLSSNSLSVNAAELIANALGCNASGDITNFETYQPLLPCKEKAPCGLKKIVFSDITNTNLDIAMIFLSQFKSLEDIEIRFDSSFANQKLCERLIDQLHTHPKSPTFKVLYPYYCDQLNFSTFLKLNQHEHCLNLGYLKMNEKNCEKALSEINFEELKHLRKLSLKGISLPDPFLKTLLDGLKSSSIEYLDLSRNTFLFEKISSSNYSILAQLISELPNLHSLDLSNNVDSFYYSDDVKNYFKNFLLKVVSGRVFNYLNISFNSLELVDKTSINFYLKLFSSLTRVEDLRFNLVLSGVNVKYLWPVLEKVSSCDKFKKVNIRLVINSNYTRDVCLILAKKISMMQNLSNLSLLHNDVTVLSKMFEVISFNNNFQILEEVSLLNYRNNYLPFDSYFSIINSLKRMHYLKDIKINNDDGLLIKIN